RFKSCPRNQHHNNKPKAPNLTVGGFSLCQGARRKQPEPSIRSGVHGLFDTSIASCRIAGPPCAGSGSGIRLYSSGLPAPKRGERTAWPAVSFQDQSGCRMLGPSIAFSLGEDI
ncbi:hypothetical protein, partial [Methylobacterium sp. Leaf87]|uniref:hypothetical protein n=1 Tax=Methylobacterium sp. Leaf87 TaxID=1736243 RepID=UPI001AEC316C